MKTITFTLLSLTIISMATCVAAGADAKPGTIHATFADGAIPDWLTPHAGAWQVVDGALRTSGDRPPCGWMIRSIDAYDLSTLSFRLKKGAPNGTVILHLKEWQVFLTPDKIDIRLSSPFDWVTYWQTIQRPINFADDGWHEFSLSFDGTKLRAQWDGEKVLSLSSPKEEWQARMNETRLTATSPLSYPDRFPESALKGKELFILVNAFDTELALDDLRIIGRSTGPANGFESANEDAIIVAPVPEATFSRLAPTNPVDVTWPLPEALAVKTKGIALTSMNAWTIPDAKKFRMPDFPVKKGQTVKPMNYFVGADAKKTGAFPVKLHGPLRWPQAINIFFNLKEAGERTLQIIFDERNLPLGGQVLEVSVNGEPVSREVYRGGVGFQRFFDFIPLKLKAGLNCVQIRDDSNHVKTPVPAMRSLAIPLQYVALAEGIVQPPRLSLANERAPDASNFQQRAATTPAWVGEHAGKRLSYRIDGLENTTYQLVLSFAEADVFEPGKRLMNVLVNGEVVESDLDVFAEAGGALKPLEKRFEVKTLPPPTPRKDENQGEGAPSSPGRHLDIDLIGTNFKAFLNGVALLDDKGTTEFSHNLGWTPPLEASWNLRRYIPTTAPSPFPLPAALAKESSENDENFVFGNLIANPHFNLEDDDRDGKPRFWYQTAELPKPAQLVPAFYKIALGNGFYSLDFDVGHAKPGSLHVTKTEKNFALFTNWPMIDYTNRQRFSFWVKTREAKGTVSGKILWFASDMDGGVCADPAAGPNSISGSPRKTPMLRLLGSSKSEITLSGTNDWTLINIEAKPPFGAVFACPLVVVADNESGDVWIDEANFADGGVEPLELSLSLAGFHPNGDKLATVSCLKATPSLSWRLINQQDGKSVKAGDVNVAQDDPLSRRHLAVIDFTDLRTTGVYRLEVKQGDASITSAPFPVNTDVYHQVASRLLNAFAFKRYNTDNPVYPPEALEDGYCRRTPPIPRRPSFEEIVEPGRVNCLGGLNDSGNWSKRITAWPAALLALNEIPQLRGVLSETLNKRLLTASRGLVEALGKFQRPDGSFHAGVDPFYPLCENLPLYGRERNLGPPIALPQAAPVAAKSSWALREANPKLSAVCRNIAERNLAYNKTANAPLPSKSGQTKTTKTNHATATAFCLASKRLWTALYLFKLTGDQQWRKIIDEALPIVIAGVNNEIYLKTMEQYRCENGGGIPQDYILALVDHLRQFPRSNQNVPIRAALRAFAANHAKLAENSPYGQAAIQGDGDSSGWFAPGVGPEYWAGLARSLALIGMELNDPDTIHLAERQLQWLLGRNFAAASAVHGVGDRWFAAGDTLFREPGFLTDWLDGGKRLFSYDGCVGTMAFRQVGDGEVRVLGGVFPPVHGNPKGRPIHFLQADYPIHPIVSGFSLEAASQILHAATAVDTALRMGTPLKN